MAKGVNVPVMPRDVGIATVTSDVWQRHVQRQHSLLYNSLTSPAAAQFAVGQTSPEAAQAAEGQSSPAAAQAACCRTNMYSGSTGSVEKTRPY